MGMNQSRPCEGGSNALDEVNSGQQTTVLERKSAPGLLPLTAR